MYEFVLSPGKIGKCELKNRFVMPAMGSGHSKSGGVVNEETIEYYCERARGGFGLIITEFCGVDEEGMCSNPQLRIYSDEFIPRLKSLSDAIHAAGAKTFLQLHHGGRVADSNVTGKQLVTSSQIPSPVATETIRSLSTKEVYGVIEKFGDAALRAKMAGFDGVEIHGGHGYLIAQFMSPYLNKRADEFGGDIAGRARMPVEIIRNIKKKCGDDFPVTIRVSTDEIVPGSMHINECRVFCRLFEEAGCDAINASVGLPFAFGDKGCSLASYRFPMGFNSYNSEELKKTLHIPVIAVGRIIDPAMADTIIADGMADYVALGRASIADPHFPRKVAAGKTDEISPCVGCMATCITGPDSPGTTCAFNPFSGRENDLKLTPAKKAKYIVVVGGGVSGLEAAWILASRGHKVTLLEKTGQLGGQARAASVPLNKQRIALVVRYYILMCRKHGVDIRLNCEATADSVLALHPDSVILCTGAKPTTLQVPNEGAEIMQAIDVLNGTVMPGRACLVVGGNSVGLETAEYLMTLWRKVTLVEPMDSVGENTIGGLELVREITDGGVIIHTSTTVRKFTRNGAICDKKDEKLFLDGFDTIVMATGFEANNPLEKELNGKVAELFVIGDALQARKFQDAVLEAAQIAVNI